MKKTMTKLSILHLYIRIHVTSLDHPACSLNCFGIKLCAKTAQPHLLIIICPVHINFYHNLATRLRDRTICIIPSKHFNLTLSPF